MKLKMREDVGDRINVEIWIDRVSIDVETPRYDIFP